jgi:urease accessory protein
MRDHTRPDSVIRWLVLVLVALAAPSTAHAHVGVGPTSGLLQGLIHPFTGLDHLAAMVGVGLWAAQIGGRARWIVPLTFVAVMSAGGLLGTLGVSIPFVEPGILASVLVLGVLIAAAVRLPLVASCLIVGLFAICHGHAHGAEMPETASGLAYGIGFVSATGFLHSCGVALGLLAQRSASPRVIRYAGGAIAALAIVLFMT